MTLHEHPLDGDLLPAPEFHLWMDLDAEPPCVGVAGELDLETCAPLRDALAQACDKSESSIALDFSHLSFIGSTGIREIAQALRRTHTIEIHGATPAVRRVFELINLGPRVVMIDAR